MGSAILSLAGALALSLTGLACAATSAGVPTPTGQAITPAAAPGAVFQPLNPHLSDAPDYTAGQASAVALSPDGKTLLILTTGFNRVIGPDGKAIAAQSNEYIFVFDVSGAAPMQRQTLTAPNTFLGLVWAPGGKAFYVSGGMDDVVLEYVGAPGAMAPGRTFKLGHTAALGLQAKPSPAGLAVSPDGRRLLVANLQNDSVSLIDLAAGAVTADQDLRPGKIDRRQSGRPGGTFPRAIAWMSDTRAYVASQRDREVIALTVGAKTITVGARIRTSGQPVALLPGLRGRLYAALDNTDGVAAIDTARGRIIETIPTAAPPATLSAAPSLGGAGSNALALSPDGRTLLVSNGGENALAVVKLSAAASGLPGPTILEEDGDGASHGMGAARAGPSAVVGLIPTGWYPTGVAVRPDGGQIYVVNGKSNTGPVPDNCRNNLRSDRSAGDACRATNEYVWQKEKAGFLTLPPPSPAQLGELTRQVASNDHFPGSQSAADAAADRDLFAFLRGHIHHVIYIVKENRTYDQMLGDLEVGNGDPRLAVFPRAMTPNQHALARNFVDLDAFFDSGESSNTGWDWSTAARTNDFTEREAPVNYGRRGLQYDQEGNNRNVNVGVATSAQRVVLNPLSPKDPDILAGAIDVAAPDGPDGAQGEGYIWNSALRAGLSVRNFGFFGDLTRYDKAVGPYRIPLEREPWKAQTTVYFPAKAALAGISDPYFRAFDQSFPDYWRFKAWEREFDGFTAAGKAPDLMLVRLPHDHTGNFADAIDGVNTVETELADNDYAVGLLVDKVAHSPFAKDTLIFVVEDDAQDGPDHVDAHRSIALIAGPYVKHGAVVSRYYTTVSLLRTIEAVLGAGPMGLNDGLASPMSEVFDRAAADWTFTAQVPAVLRTTQLPLPPATSAEAACPSDAPHPSTYWSAAMSGQDFREEDRLNTGAFNLALWRGLKGAAAYPAARGARDLRDGRDALLASARLPCG